MKIQRFFICVLLFLSASSAMASDFLFLRGDSTGRDLYYSMKLLVSEEKPSKKDMLNLSYAYGYIASSSQSIAFVRSSISGKDCAFPQNVTADQLARMVIRYLDQNPDQWDISPPFGLFFFATHTLLICDD